MCACECVREKSIQQVKAPFPPPESKHVPGSAVNRQAVGAALWGLRLRREGGSGERCHGGAGKAAAAAAIGSDFGGWRGRGVARERCRDALQVGLSVDM